MLGQFIKPGYPKSDIITSGGEVIEYYVVGRVTFFRFV